MALNTSWRDSRIWAMALGETIVWAGMYYTFAALIGQWESDLHWSKSELAIGFTSCLLVSALCSPIVGNFIDKGFGRRIMVGGASAGGLLLLLMSQISHQWQFVSLWALLGIASACCFYDPCFSYLTHTRGTQAKGAITLVTLAAGFAGTVSFPTANALSELYHWRVALVFFAVVILIVAVPLFWWATGNHSANNESVHDRKGYAKDKRAILTHVMGGSIFWLLALCFGLVMLSHGSLVTHFLPMMDERGMDLKVAVLAASLLGPVQVLGRLLMMHLERWLSIVQITAMTILCLVAASVALYVDDNSRELVFVFIVFQGMGIGIFSIVRPLIIAELFGYQGFGAISGMISLFSLVAMAAAPSLAAWLWLINGYSLVISIMLMVAIGAAVVFGLIIIIRRFSVSR